VAIGCSAVVGVLILLGIIGSFASSGQTAVRATPAPASKATAIASARPAGAASASAAPTRDGSCTPQPCANDNYGWIVTVSNVKYGASSGNQFNNPEPGNVFVTMDLTFTNKTSDSRPADESMFKLIDGGGVSHDITLMVSCPSWQGVDVGPGASYGPKCIAFQATGGKPAGLVLIWNPSYFGGSYKMKLS